MWLSFSPVPALTAVYYGISVSDVDMFSIIFFIVSLVVGFVAIILLDKVGLKVPVSQWVCVESVCIIFLAQIKI